MASAAGNHIANGQQSLRLNAADGSSSANSTWTRKEATSATYRQMAAAPSRNLPTVAQAGYAANEAGADSGSNLKWRARRPASLPGSPVSPSRPTASPFDDGPSLRSVEPSRVRQAAELAPVDPFDDPFNDSQGNQLRAAQHSETPPRKLISLEPPHRSARQPGPVDPAPPAGVEPDAAGAVQPPADVIPPPQKRKTDPCDGEDRDRPGDQHHFGRNCSAEGRLCDCFKEHVRTYTIDKISLDITPDYQPSEDNEAERLKQNQQRLAAAEPREWRNFRNEVVANGRLVDFEDREAIIKDASGQTTGVAFDELSNMDVCYLTALWKLPGECRLGEERRSLEAGRENWIASTFTWKASNLCHKPLYFEQRNLERYGHTAGPILQPVISGAHFFANIAVLPYQMGMYPPGECRYALGYYRPGDCAPWMIDPIPLSLRGAIAQTGAVLGAVYVIP